MNTATGDANRAGAIAQRDFRKYIASTFFATIAMMIQSVAVAWQVYDLSRSPMVLGYVGLFQFLPLAIFALPAGELADRVDRRAMLAATYVVQAVCAALLITLAIETPRTLWPFYIVLALFGTARAFAAPASQALLPQLVEEERFPRAVALTSSTRQTAVIIGPALGGAIYILGPGAAYAACFVFFVAVVALLLTINARCAAARHNADTTEGLARLTACISYIRRRPLSSAPSLISFGPAGRSDRAVADYARDILHVGWDCCAPAVGAARHWV